MSSTLLSNAMKILKKKVAKVTHPTGNPNFAVYSGFPAALTETESDPFLLCDHFGPEVSKGVIDDPDEFMAPWHPHRGFDICTYFVKGVSRHADSMGNRGSFQAPGLQWISVGSGIEHAEGGATPKGELMEGFQIWVNVPSAKKMDDPRYGTNENALQIVEHDGWRVRVVAGKEGDVVGPFSTVQEVQIADVMIDAQKSGVQRVAAASNNAIVYVYAGAGKVLDQDVKLHDTLLLDASDPTARDISFLAGPAGLSFILFSGVRLNQPIAWRGPIVMTTQDEVRQAYMELATGTFLKKQAPFDYKSHYEWLQHQEKLKSQSE